MKSTISRKYPTYRDDPIKGHKRWLDGKRLDDNAEGLWRVHDKLYDLSDFVKLHPGGSEWLKVTKGIDITEQFEIHHISSTAEKLLPQFFVRVASLPRNYKTTFNENGFYKTLKRRVANKLDFLDHTDVAHSRFYCDFLLATTLLLSTIAARDNNYLIASFASLSFMWLAVIAHNFIHQKDNWRMYIINLTLTSVHDWRVFHAMSHHLYPNSYHDLEITFFEPFLNWMPVVKTSIQKYRAWAMTPVLFSFIFAGEFYHKVASIIMYRQKFHWDELLPLVMPAMMFYLGNAPFWVVIKMWLFILFFTSFMYGLLSVNVGHHHTEVFHDGDELESMDFGVYQLAATVDRSHIKESLFLTLTHFGHHTLHHFFPTLDHSLLPQLQETFLSTCFEFQLELREYSWWTLIVGQFQQLARTETKKINFN